MISVVIPIKKERNEYWSYLPRAINSVLIQTFEDFELTLAIYDNDVSQGRNAGIRKSQGEWILTLDADDELEPNFLEEVSKHFEYYDIIGTDAIFLPSGRRFNAIPNTDFEVNNGILSCSIFKKDVWDKYNFNETIGGYEDWDFWLKAKRNGFSFGAVNIPLVKIYERDTSRNKDAIKKHNELLKQILK